MGHNNNKVLIATSHAPGYIWAISLESFRAVWGLVNGYLAFRRPLLALTDISEAIKMDKTHQCLEFAEQSAVAKGMDSRVRQLQYHVSLSVPSLALIYK